MCLIIHDYLGNHYLVLKLPTIARNSSKFFYVYMINGLGKEETKP